MSAPPARLADHRLRGAWILGVAVVLCAAAVVALGVQYRTEAEPWERVFVWAALGLGFVSIALSLTAMVLSASSLTTSRGTLLLLRSGTYVVPILGAVTLGYLAAPDKILVQGARFPVYGTCLYGSCTLKQRTGPGPSIPVVPHHLTDGTPVLVVCQVQAESPSRVKSPIWDKLDTGLYVSDAFVLTPARNRFSSILPRCHGGRTAASG